MNPRLIPLIIASLVVIGIPRCRCQNDDQYRTCSEPLRCGRLGEIGYPFWGGTRPESCGYRGFNLTCQGDDDDPLINIASITYRVLEINDSTRTLRVSRNDLWRTLCPRPSIDATIDSNLFSFYTSVNDQNVTLYYGCSGARPSNFPYEINCDNGWGFFLPMGERWPGPGIQCGGQISVRVNQSAAEMLAVSSITLQDAIQGGFSIQWQAENDKCEACALSGGLCGYNQGTSSFACHCTDGTFESACDGHRTGNGDGSNSRSLIIGLPIAVVGGFGFVWLIFFFMQRRRRRFQRLASQSTQTTGKKVSTPPSSDTPLSTPPSTYFTKSIPSYPSSNSDLGRSCSSTYFGTPVFNCAELEKATDNFTRELGDGGFGTVYYGVLCDGRVVAVKRLHEYNYRRVEQFITEVQILTTLRHENLVSLYGCTSKHSKELLLVYEYIPNGTVADHLHGTRAKSGLLSWPIRLNIAIETAGALAYLHKSKIIHRDVKTNNILLDNDFHVKVADFGLSRLFPTDVTHVSTAPQGTPGYVDPEYYQCYKLTEKSDVYSFGVVLVELISSLQAVDTSRDRLEINLANMAVNKIQNRMLHELVDSSLGFETNTAVRRMATLVAELAFQCLQQERDMRPSMEQVLEGLRGIQNEDLNAHKVEIVDMLVDDETGPLKAGAHPSSPESV